MEDMVGNKYGNLTVLEMLPRYKNGKMYCRCKCECGNERTLYYYDLIKGKSKACVECTKRIQGELKRKDYTGKRFGRLVITQMLWNYGDNKKTHVKCLCDCGNEKIIQLNNIISGHTQSCGCLEVESRYTREHYIDITGNKYGKLTVVKKTDQKSNNGSVIWECICDCGNITYSTYNNLTSGHTLSCGCNKDSKWEALIRDYLQEHNISYKAEYTFNDCTNIQGNHMLPFDFYIEDVNIIIEYDGQHHFEPIEYWGGQDKFEITQRNDLIKNLYCADKGIRLIRIPYTMKKDEVLKLLDELFMNK